MAVTNRKILLKVLKHDKNEQSDKWAWVHFCYVPEDLYIKFFQVTGCDKSAFGGYLSKWAQEDFKIKLKMSSFEDIQKLKAYILDHFIYAYNEIYTQRLGVVPEIRGWIRLWVSQNMMKEIQKYEYECD